MALPKRASPIPFRRPLESHMTETRKSPNHALSEMRCPVSLDDVDLFGAPTEQATVRDVELAVACPLDGRGQGFA